MQPMEPMDTYLCVLLELRLVNSPGSYQQQQICSLISANQTSFDQIYNDQAKCEQVRLDHMTDVRMIDVVDKIGDCGLL